MSVELLNQRREPADRGQDLESRVSALENYIALLIGTNDIATNIALAGTVTIGGRLCSTVASAINAVGELTAANFNTSSKQILSDFTFGTSGAIKMITDVNNGLWLSPGGILGKKAGATTFSIDTSGNAAFGGSLVGASGTFGTITAGSLTGLTITGGTITGGIIRTATSGKRVELNSTGNLNEIALYNADNTLSGKFYGAGAEVQGGPWLFLTAKTYIDGSVLMTGNLTLHGGGEHRITMRDGITDLTWITVEDVSPYNVQINRSWLPYPTNVCDLGTSAYKWRYLFLDQDLQMDAEQGIWWGGTHYWRYRTAGYIETNTECRLTVKLKIPVGTNLY